MTGRRRPGLDVLRATAILLVVLHHFRNLPGVPDAVRWFGLRGYVGVDVFFVLSGWLIGGQLVREHGRTGTVDVPRFWTRRWLRTVPAYGVMLAVLTGLGRIPAAALVPMAVFVQNYAAPDAWLVTWSLCIEEQFYLVLPFVALALGRLPRGPRRFLIVVLIALSPVLRALTWDAMHAGTYSAFISDWYVRTHLRLDGLALGVACAALAEAAHPLWARLSAIRSPLAIAGAVVAIAATWTPWLTGGTIVGTDRMAFFPAVLGFLVVAFGVALTLPWASHAETRIPGARAFEWLADHAYTLYLTHELVGAGVSRRLVHAFGDALPWWAIFGVCLGLAGVSAWALRQAVELPFLRWRDRVAARPAVA